MILKIFVHCKIQSTPKHAFVQDHDLATNQQEQCTKEKRRARERKIH